MELTDLQGYHQSHFGAIDYQVWAPGRINLIGEHTDYNNGYVLPAAIDSGISFLFTFSEENDRFEVYSENLDQYESFHRDDDILPPRNWAKYLQALIHLLREKEGIRVPGFQMSLKSTIPRGGGLSSSAALIAGFILAINEQGRHQWALKKMAQLAQYTEHRVGVRVGIMDPFAILTGKQNHFIKINCRTNEYERVPAEMKGHVILLVDTGISHDLAESAYNDRRKTCEKVLEAANTIRIIKDVSGMTAGDLKKVRENCPDLSTTEVSYVIQENDRVLKAVQFLQQGEISKVGELMYASHTGLRDRYRVSCEELDFLVDLAKEFGIPGARMMGGGFGGSTINLLPEADLEEFISYVSKRYKKKYGLTPVCLSVHPADGAKVVNF